MNKFFITVIVITVATLTIIAAPHRLADGDSIAAATDTVSVATDSAKASDNGRYTRLTDEDYQKVADELSVDIATMKAVVEIEAGKSHQGFVSPGKPLINFDLTMFRRHLRQAGISTSKYKGYTCFKPVNSKKYGGYGNAQWARMESARTINSDAANKSAFWGMFQIGGFNWKSCGCATIDEFVERMSESEAEQLELFAQFCINRDLVKYLKKKDWSNFAYHYNGPSYKKRGYHHRLRSAHAKHSK